MMKIIIDNHELTQIQLQNWIYSRIRSSYKLLQDNLKLSDVKLEYLINQKDILGAQKRLAQLKYDLGVNRLTLKLTNKIKLANRMVKILTKLSRGKRKFSETTFVINRRNRNIEDILSTFEKLQLVNSDLNRYANLLANPDHYVSRGYANNQQEVIEVTGSAILPSDFIIKYGETTGLKSKKDTKLQYDLPGVARLKDGTIIGGVRHQFGQDNHYLYIKTLVEFPKYTPDYVVNQHKLHLACEFGHWLQQIITEL